MLRSLVLSPFALALGLLLAKGEADASTTRVDSCPSECDSCTGGACHIECGPGSSCAAQIVTCPAGMDCDVACSGDAACRSATIIGPSGSDLELSCEGDDACDSATLVCGTGGCDWSCVTHGSCAGISVE
jgi:hypothetical protein